MDKNRLLGWMLIFGIILVWLEFNKREALKEQNNNKTAQTIVDSSSVDSQPIPSEPQPKINLDLKPEKQLGTLSQEAFSDTSETSDSNQVAPPKTIWVATNKFVVELQTVGAIINSVALNLSDSNEEPHYSEIINRDSTGVGSLWLAGNDLSKINWQTPYSGPDTLYVDDHPKELVFFSPLSQDTLVRKYLFYPDSNFVRHQLTTGKYAIPSFSLVWASGMRESEPVPTEQGIGLGANFFSEVVINYGDQNVSRLKPSKREVYNQEAGVLRWVGLRRKYTAAILNFNQERQYKVSANPLSEAHNADWPTYSLEISGQDYEPGHLNYDLVFFTLKHNELKKYNQGYEKILFSGYAWFLGADSWYPKLCGLVLRTLNRFYQWIPNYGIAIILLTLLVRSILLPLTISQTRAMSKQQELAPHLKEIREKYKGEPQKMFQAQKDLYKEKGVNQAAALVGCLPMFLQFPVFIALFNVLGRSIELKEASFFAWIGDLSQPDVIWEGLKIPYLFPMGLTILPFFMAITMYFQTKMTITDPKQKPMVIMMPIMMFVFSASFPSGLVLYWTVSNVFTIVQTKALKRNTAPSSQESVKGKIPANAVSRKKSRKK